MIKITKGREPLAWSAKKATPGFTEYQPIRELRSSLMEEQGHICAYCMRRIPAKDPNSDAASKIEHIKSQEDRPDLQLKYNNMAICCPGNMDNDPHCDTLKGGNSITFSLHNQLLQNSISYSSSDGGIKSNNATWNDEMNRLLNLNHKTSKLNRFNALDGIIEAIKSKGWDTATLATQLTKWSSLNKKGQFEPYCGIAIWYLEKILRQRRKSGV